MRHSQTLFTITAAVGGLASASCTSMPQGSQLSVRQPATKIATGCESLADSARATIVIFEPARNRRLVCNAARADVRFTAASTYKVAHTLIAFETGRVANVDTAFRWDGRDRGVPAWNRDLTLRQAVASSAVWVFQKLATRIGFNAEREWVRKLGYGNRDIGTPSDLRHFWLSGPLAISAHEQIDFLRRLVTRGLPVSEATASSTIATMHLGETSEGYPVYGKTGAMLPIDDEGFLKASPEGLLPANVERTGWFIGWIDRPRANGGPVYFAHNLDLALPDAMNGRTTSAYAVLRSNGYTTPG